MGCQQVAAQRRGLLSRSALCRLGRGIGLIGAFVMVAQSLAVRHLFVFALNSCPLGLARQPQGVQDALIVVPLPWLEDELKMSTTLMGSSGMYFEVRSNASFISRVRRNATSPRYSEQMHSCVMSPWDDHNANKIQSLFCMIDAIFIAAGLTVSQLADQILS